MYATEACAVKNSYGNAVLADKPASSPDSIIGQLDGLENEVASLSESIDALDGRIGPFCFRRPQKENGVGPTAIPQRSHIAETVSRIRERVLALRDRVTSMSDEVNLN